MTTHGRFKRFSDRTFFGNRSSTEGHQAEVWKMALNRKNLKRTMTPGGTVEEAEVSPLSERFVLLPSSGKRAFWEVIGVTLLVWDMFFIPFLTFESETRPFDLPAVFVLEVCSLLYWTFDVAASFSVGFYRSDGMIEMAPKAIAMNYIKSWFLYDITCVGVDYVIHLLDHAVPSA